MKRKLSILIATLASLVVLAPSSALAQVPTDPLTNVTGVVTYNNMLVPDAHVTVECEGHTMQDITNDKGTYLVSFAGDDCPKDSFVSVTAQKDSRGGSSSGYVVALTTKLNVTIINVAIPEFGTIAGVSAAFTAGGAFLISRKRAAKHLQ